MSLTGFLKLKAKRQKEKTILSKCYYEGALKVTRPVYLEEYSPTIYLIHVGGGYVDGDCYQTEITLEEGAEASITSQSYTKVYKTPNLPVSQKTMIILKENSILEYMPDPLIAYEGARYIQETDVYLNDQSCLFFSDVITPGWSVEGTPFQYNSIRSKLKVYKGEKLVLFDHLLLEPDLETKGLLQMDQHTHMGTFLIIHERADKGFLDSLYNCLVEFNEKVRFGLSTLPEYGVILRVFAQNTGAIEKIIAISHKFARKELLGKNDLVWRKY